MMTDILAGLARANLAASVAILLVLMLRKPVRRRFGAQVAYALWAVIPIVAAGAFVPPATTAAPLIAPVMLDAAAMAGGAVEASVTATPTLPSILIALWITGALGVAALMLRRQARFMAALGRLEQISPRLFRAEQAGSGPAVVGAFRPRIVTPADFEVRFGPDEREVILAHEGAHLASGDAPINALAATALCACWFNPLVHLAVHFMRLDQELACDAAVLGRFPQARRLYGEVLLKTQLATQLLPFGCLWPAASEHPLKERIVMLKSPLPAMSRRIAGMSAVAALGVAGACAAWAAQPGGAGHSGLEPEQARRLAGPHGNYDCKPDANHELHNCRILHGSPWARIATAADVARAYPPQALKAGLTADVLLKCGVNSATGGLEDCASVGIDGTGGKALPPGLNEAFERAAVKVAGLYRLKATPPEGDPPIASPMYMAIQFRKNPVMPGGPPANPAPTHAPAALPVPAEASSLITQPDWIARPTGADIARLYPAQALKQGVTGRVTMTCRVDAAGRLQRCKVKDVAVTGENLPVGSNADLGFRAATLQLGPLFQMKPLSKDGVATAGAEIRIPVRWGLPQSAAR